jgi:rare lipoprotein A
LAVGALVVSVSLAAIAREAEKPLSTAAKNRLERQQARAAAGYQVGKASWYGDDFGGRPTASGQSFDKHELTAAHPSLPLNSIARITNLANGRSVTVTVNDRGPFHKDRIIDLSQSAAREIGMMRRGVATVLIEPLGLFAGAR